MRSFVFVERISEVTDVFARERSFKAVSDAISKDAGVADVSGYTDYGRVWREFLAAVEDDLHPRATVIVLGDARTNGRDPRADVFARIAERAGRTFWLNPEPRLYWNYGDSVIAAYEPYCEAYECWTTRQLEDFVKALTRPHATPDARSIFDLDGVLVDSTAVVERAWRRWAGEREPLGRDAPAAARAARTRGRRRVRAAPRRRGWSTVDAYEIADTDAWRSLPVRARCSQPPARAGRRTSGGTGSPTGRLRAVGIPGAPVPLAASASRHGMPHSEPTGRRPALRGARALRRDRGRLRPCFEATRAAACACSAVASCTRRGAHGGGSRYATPRRRCARRSARPARRRDRPGRAVRRRAYGTGTL